MNYNYLLLIIYISNLSLTIQKQFPGKELEGKISRARRLSEATSVHFGALGGGLDTGRGVGGVKSPAIIYTRTACRITSCH